MKIGICGTHCTGKSTLAKAAADALDFVYFGNITRQLAKRGVKINEEGDDYTQMRIMAEHVRALSHFDNFVCDRTVIDAYAYSQVGKRVTADMKGVMEAIAETYVNSYDYIFFLPMDDVKLKEDEIRSTSKQYRQNVETSIMIFLEKFNVKHYVLRGTVKERVEIMKNIIKNGGVK